MKIVIGQPPLSGYPQVMQNRQYACFERPTYIYPVIPASAATLLDEMGHDVFWMDGMASGLDLETYLTTIEYINPDLICWEVKTPTVKKVWRLVGSIKETNPETLVCLFGDHVTALPKETLENSRTNIVLKGGNYDLLLKSLVESIDLMDLTLKTIWDIPSLTHLDHLPVIDRDLTSWKMYAYKNGNFKEGPGTYTQFSRDCWWRPGCSFCSWTSTHPYCTTISPETAMKEVENCASIGAKEIFDDSGTFPRGEWLHQFIARLEQFNTSDKTRKIRFGCNIRGDGFREDDFNRMGRSGFEFVLIGCESANESTLQRIGKGESTADIERTMRYARKAGMEVHATFMLGFPWEGREEINHSLGWAKSLFERGLIHSLQCTLLIPYPGTRLYREANERGWLRSQDWNDYDMSKPILKTKVSGEELMSSIKKFYLAALAPRNLVRRVFSIRSRSGFNHLLKTAGYFFGKIK